MGWGGKNTLEGVSNTQIAELAVSSRNGSSSRAKTFKIIIMQAYFWLMKDWSRKSKKKSAGKLNAKGLLGWETQDMKTL